MPRNIWIVTGAMLAWAAPGALVAQAPPPAAASQPLTRASFIATMDAEYKKIDTNRDGIVTKNEVEANQQRIAAEAAAERARAIFTQVDTDRNGQLSLAEFSKASSGQSNKVDGSGVMGRLDTNRDQKVTLVEYRILTLAGFDRLDADRDGILTAAEQRAGGVAK